MDENLSVTLWDKFAIEFDADQLQEKANGSAIVIFASMIVRNYRDQLYISTCSASRTYSNLEIQEVMDFRNNLCRRETSIATMQQIKSLNEPILSPYEQISINRRTIEELLKLNSDDLQDSKYTCKEKLVTIDPTYGWWYKACHDCKGSVNDYEDSFWCGRCGKRGQAPIPWYKLNAIVEDETGSANFTIFGKVAQNLIHAPAHQLATAINSNRNVLPTAIKNILGRNYIFQVQTDSRTLNFGVPSFRVTKIFAPDLDAKEKGKQISTNVEGMTEEATDAVTIATRSHHELSEMSPDLPVESLITQPNSEILQLGKRKRSFSVVEDCTSDEE